MRIRTRILLASGFYRFGGTVALLVAAYFVHPVFAFASIAWLSWSRRIIRQWLLPPLFRYATCGHCRRQHSLKTRWRCMVDQWTDSQVRHALAVYSDQGHEVRSFDCDHCGSTISLQKGDKELYRRWKPADAFTSTARSSSRPQFGIRIGVDRKYEPGLLARAWRLLRGRPIREPIIVSNEVASRHGTIFGATGQGKSTLILNLARQIFESGDGATFLDPAGDLSRDLIKLVPPGRIDDVLYIDVGDQAFPFPFNILHATDKNERTQLVDEVLSIFKTIYAKSWGETLAHQLRMALNAVLEFGGSFQDVYDLFAKPEVRQRLVRKIKTKELRDYWNETFPSTSLSARMSIINKLEPIVNHSFLGPILASRECAFDADDVIRNRKILIVNLATGTRAPHVVEMIGTFVVNKIVAAAYRQGNIEDRDQRVRHFFFVDEFQNFMHKASGWDRSLSELRKFKLCLILATQYVDQVAENIRAAIFGNVGFLLAFRVGHKDSKVLSEEFEGTSKQELLDLQRGECLVRIGTHAMAVKTEPPPAPQPMIKRPSKENPQEIEEVEIETVITERMHRLISELRSAELVASPVVKDFRKDEEPSKENANEIGVDPTRIMLVDYA